MIEGELGHVVDTVWVQVYKLLQLLLGCCAQCFLYYRLDSLGEVELVAEVK